MSSGKALLFRFRTPPKISGTEHSAFYNNGDVRKFTIACIAQLAENYRKTQV
jgi:hypothetical protein